MNNELNTRVEILEMRMNEHEHQAIDGTTPLFTTVLYKRHYLIQQHRLLVTTRYFLQQQDHVLLSAYQKFTGQQTEVLVLFK